MADDVLTDRRGQILLLSVAAVALFLDGLDGTIVNVVLPDMAKDFGTDTSATSWVVTAYYVMMAGLILIFGKVCDAGALKRVFTFGLVVFAVGSLACGLSGTLSVMLVSRVVQGIGAAMLASSAFMVGIRYLPKSMSGFVLSVSVLGIAVGSAAGPLLGAVLAEFSSWHMVFLINVPIAAVAAVVAVRVVPSDAGFSGRGFDIKGAALLFVALVCGLYVLESSPSHGFDTVSVVCTALFLVCISLFAVTEMRAVDPVIKLRLFRSRGLLSAMFLLTIVNMCYLGCLYLLPYYMSTVMGLDSLGTGLYLAIPAVATLLLCVWVGRAADRIGNRPFTIAASALMVASMVAYVFADADHVMPLIAGLVLMGVMWGLGGGTISNRMLDNMPDEDRPAGASMSSFLIYLGCAAGTAMFAGLFGFGSGSSGTAIGDLDAATFLDGFALACIAGAILSAIGLMLSVSKDVSHTDGSDRSPRLDARSRWMDWIAGPSSRRRSRSPPACGSWTSRYLCSPRRTAGRRRGP